MKAVTIARVIEYGLLFFSIPVPLEGELLYKTLERLKAKITNGVR